MSQICSSARLWVCVAFVFIAASVALSVYVIYIKVVEDDKTEMSVLERYSGLFRTVKEQQLVEQQYQSGLETKNLIPATITQDDKLKSCAFGCRTNTTNLRGTTTDSSAIGNPIYHGCCISQHLFISPDTALDPNGNNVTLVQYSTKRQYFPSQICRHVDGCTGCGCAQEPAMHMASIKDGNNYLLSLIILPGCCKCLEGLSPPSTAI